MYPSVLSIAGSDSIGGAGIQADIKTCCAFGVYGMTAVTAVTAQNTLGVKSYETVSPTLLSQQINAVFDDVKPDAVKIGMVPDAASAEVIANILYERQASNIVVDPVMVATSGDVLSGDGAAATVARRLCPLAAVITPNIPEARALLGEDAKCSIGEWPRLLAEKYCCHAVLVKGGHAEGDTLVDMLWVNGLRHDFSHELISTRNTHGTGCSLSSAIACGLAEGLSVTEAVNKAISWLQRAIAAGAADTTFKGHGSVNFFVR